MNDMNEKKIDDDIDLLFVYVRAELRNARAKFPKQDIWKTLAALTEEIGELNQAILEYHDQPEKNVTRQHIKKELVQSIVMLVRIAKDCDMGL